MVQRGPFDDLDPSGVLNRIRHRPRRTEIYEQAQVVFKRTRRRGPRSPIRSYHMPMRKERRRATRWTRWDRTRFRRRRYCRVISTTLPLPARPAGSRPVHPVVQQHLALDLILPAPRWSAYPDLYRGFDHCRFSFIRLLPGDPVLLMAGERGLSEERHAELMKQFGFDRPIWEQYLGLSARHLPG